MTPNTGMNPVNKVCLGYLWVNDILVNRISHDCVCDIVICVVKGRK